jgi:hypothetical protein
MPETDELLTMSHRRVLQFAFNIDGIMRKRSYRPDRSAESSQRLIYHDGDGDPLMAYPHEVHVGLDRGKAVDQPNEVTLLVIKAPLPQLYGATVAVFQHHKHTEYDPEYLFHLGHAAVWKINGA